jgi:hypothetical protein
LPEIGTYVRRFDDAKQRVLPASLRFLRPADGPRGDRQGDSGHVAIAVTVAFGGLEPVAELEQLIKQPARLRAVEL